MSSPIASSHSINASSSTTSLSPSIAGLNALSSPKPVPQNIHVQQQRRMTASSLPPPSSLNLPEPVYGHPNHVPTSPRRTHSPLRNDFVPRRSSQDSQSGDDIDDDGDDENGDADSTWVRSQSPSASVTQFAANLAHRVGSLISSAPGNGTLPTDAELEAEAQRERDQSRREAERILTREAEERRAMEERVLALMNSSPQSLPPPRGRSQTMPNPPSPATSAKDGVAGWWAAAKSRLTPTKEKEVLTPAQQVVEDTRAREKDPKTPKAKDRNWPASGSSKYGDPAYLNLSMPPGGPLPRSSSPASPTPNRTPARLTPAPAPQPINLSPISLQRGTSPGGSPAREHPPLYASFTASGTLDLPGTLLVIAKRFEKLERWTVSHVRALEERMGDVERWLVDKEDERAKGKWNGKEQEQETKPSEADLSAMRDDITELQSRIGELGREMAHFATSPTVLSTNLAARESPAISTAPHTESSFTTMSCTGLTGTGISTPVVGVGIVSTPRRVPSLSARESTSPPLARVGPSKTSARSGTRLPYPTGDYASPSDVTSTTHTPANSPPATTRPTSMVISGLPPISSPLELPTSMSPPARTMSPTPIGLPPPSIQAARRGSVSPTPLPGSRKRYTVALGGPIVAPQAEADYESESTDDDDDDDDYGAETVGKKAASRAVAAAKLVGGEDIGLGQTSSSPRARAQSTYGGFSGAAPMQSKEAMSKQHRLRSQSTDFRSGNTLSGDHQHSRFVDPLVLRRQSKTEKAKDNKPLVGPGKKVPVGQLVAFFDAERI
ncbi:hypothetical protein PAXRUDRAFT_25244 [Paxillus rubicundulus Ve08.2h10]|uniref:Uncharacterized protein n=1 Tax=Paxillus rubicundulus Ve08.2h10 TaxID=930991 RepID=A0A0D0DS42_9AGAM|nr:hypothetical protein PAXRUDRAFT_25244 [Paxillus rubicundulus Ve08.2h10]